MPAKLDEFDIEKVEIGISPESKKVAIFNNDDLSYEDKCKVTDILFDLGDIETNEFFYVRTYMQITMYLNKPGAGDLVGFM